MEPFPFHAVTKEDCYKYLEVGDIDNNSNDDSNDDALLSSPYQQLGLTTAQAQERLDQYGPNQLSSRTQKTIWQRIWYQIANVLVAILVVVSVVSAAQAIRFATMTPPDQENVVTNSIQVALLVSLIM
jgi:magnesium-transporting ATPase (P-type)